MRLISKFINSSKIRFLLLGIMLCALSLSFILSINYWRLDTDRYIDRDFDLSKNFLKFKRITEDKVAPFDIINPDDRLAVLSFYKNSREAGFMDNNISFLFAIQAYNREFDYGFNTDDYRSEAKVSMPVVAKPSMKEDDESHMFEIPPQNKVLYNKGIDRYTNLFALKYMGDMVYIDSSDESLIKKYKHIFTENGYEVVGDGNVSYLDIITKYANLHPRAYKFLKMSGFVYILASISIFYFVKSDLKRLHLYYVHGANMLRVFIKDFTRFQFVSLLATILSAMYFIWISRSYGVDPDIIQITTDTLIHLVIVFIAYLTAFALNWRKIPKYKKEL